MMSAMHVPLCEPWPLPPSGCPDLTESPAVSGFAVQAASEILWERTGYRFGSCELTIRPCRRDCRTAVTRWWDGWTWPTLGTWPPSMWWWDAVCGRCRQGCACNTADTLTLPQLVQSVTEVVIDGVVLPTDAYNLFDGDKLVRADGELWPLCQDWTVPVSGTGAWHVKMVAGRPVPGVGQLALAEVAAEIAKLCQGEKCRFPAYTTQKTRQGVSQSFPPITELREAKLTGFQWVDLFLDTVDPDRAGTGAAIWNPDDYADGGHGRGYRTAGGAW